MIDKLIKILDKDLREKKDQDAIVAFKLLKSLGLTEHEIGKKLVELAGE